MNKPLCAPDILNVATYPAVYGHFIAGMHEERYDSGIKNCSDKERIYELERGVDRMTGRRGCRAVALLLLTLSVAMLAGCRETPEESAVASRAGGLPEDAVIEPLADGETQIIELPDKWQQTEKWSKDRWIFEADVDLESIETGNLPVIEMAQRSMTQEELEKLAEYFADGQELYKPVPTTKDVFQDKLDRMNNAEGIYAVYTIDTAFGMKKEWLEKGLAAAPETADQTPEKAEVTFGPRQPDPGADEAMERSRSISPETDAMPLFFFADVGEQRNSSIEARNYDADTGLTGKFEWMDGDTLLYQKNDIDMDKGMHVEYKDVSETDRQWEELLDACTARMTDENIDPEEGKKQAESVLADLGLTDKVYASAEPVLWFPSGTYPDDVGNTGQDSLWQADLDEAEAGYVYTFLNEVGGLGVNFTYGGRTNGYISGVREEAYAPAFKVETVEIAVTESGVKYFAWTGMSEAVSTVAENVKILPFDKMKDRMTEYVSYQFPGSQPADSESRFMYEVEDLTFGYTYLTAYENPDHAWAVPAWFLELKSGQSAPELTGSDEIEMTGWAYFTFSAIDGGGVEN